jgi:hypothetical protein
VTGKLKVVQKFATLVEAELAQGMLESAGIASVVSADDCGGMQPQLRMSMGVRLLVDESDLEDAQQVLLEHTDDLDDWDE